MGGDDDDPYVLQAAATASNKNSIFLLTFDVVNLTSHQICLFQLLYRAFMGNQPNPAPASDRLQ